jgi:rubrerythrin
MLGQFGKLGLGAAALAVPFIGMAEKVQAAKYGGPDMEPEDDIAILNYALTLEYLEYSFYARGVESAGIPSEVVPLFTDIRDHELAHVELLRGAISGAGGTPVFYTIDDFDFTIAGFDPFDGDNYAGFLTISQGLEDTGVRAYKGQAARIDARTGPNSILTTALQILSVEARHAAAVRILRGELTDAYIPFDQPGVAAPIAATYAGEENTVQGAGAGGGDLATIFDGTYSPEIITEAFDEILTAAETLAIATPFITGDGEPDEDP